MVTRWFRQTFFILLAGTLLGLALVRCAPHKRVASSDLNVQKVSAKLDEMAGTDSPNQVPADVTIALRYRSSSKIYFAEAPGAFGPVGSLLAIRDWSFLNLDPGATAALGYRSIKNARVALLNHAGEGGGRDLGLVIGIDQGSGFVYFGFSGSARRGRGELEADLVGGNKRKVTIQTEDLKGDDLADVIQLKLYANDNFIGKISTLLLYRN